MPRGQGMKQNASILIKLCIALSFYQQKHKIIALTFGLKVFVMTVLLKPCFKAL